MLELVWYIFSVFRQSDITKYQHCHANSINYFTKSLLQHQRSVPSYILNTPDTSTNNVGMTQPTGLHRRLECVAPLILGTKFLILQFFSTFSSFFFHPGLLLFSSICDGILMSIFSRLCVLALPFSPLAMIDVEYSDSIDPLFLSPVLPMLDIVYAYCSCSVAS